VVHTGSMSTQELLLTAAEVDRALRYPRGRSIRLARRGVLPHVVLPDGEIRFEREAIADLLANGRTAGKGGNDAE